MGKRWILQQFEQVLGLNIVRLERITYRWVASSTSFVSFLCLMYMFRAFEGFPLDLEIGISIFFFILFWHLGLLWLRLQIHAASKCTVAVWVFKIQSPYVLHVMAHIRIMAIIKASKTLKSITRPQDNNRGYIKLNVRSLLSSRTLSYQNDTAIRNCAHTTALTSYFSAQHSKVHLPLWRYDKTVFILQRMMWHFC